MTNYYLVFVYDDIEPEIKGPYPSEEMRDDVAFDLRKNFGKNHGIYPLNINGRGVPKIDAYFGGFFMGLEDE